MWEDAGGGAGGGDGGGSGTAGGGTDGGTGDKGGATRTQGVDEDRIADKVWHKVRDALGGLLGDGKLEVDDGAGEGDGGDGTGDGEPQHPSGAQVEDLTEERVRAILGKVRDEDDHKHEHEHLKHLVEASPVPQSRTYRAMFGAGKR